MNLGIAVFVILAATAADANNRSKIIGGSTVDIFNFPYQLQLKSSRGLCGGSIISANWALTAAHCIYGASQAIFRSGSSYWGVGGRTHTSYRILWHNLYNIFTSDYDIAVVAVWPNFVIGTPGVVPVRLPLFEPATGSKVVVSGWGSTTKYKDPVTYQLKALPQITISRTSCSTYYKLLGSITTRMICALNVTNSACSGDSGGPLVDTTTSLQVGVVSWGDRCTTTRPDVYTNVAYFRKWISMTTGV